MELACLNTHFLAAGMTLPAFLDACVDSGIGVVEVGVANRMASPDADAIRLLRDRSARKAFAELFAARGLRIGALNCFGNPLHPRGTEAAADIRGVEATIELASELGVRTVVGASGCPGDEQWPVWISWPLYWDALEPKEWKQAIDTWARLATRADDAGVDLCLKLHPGQIVHNVTSFIRLADACGARLKADIDPAHCFYLGMDPVAIVRHLGPRVGHLHAKDAIINAERMALDGAIDTSPLDQLDRSWRCAAVGEGHDLGWWASLFEALSDVGYAGLVSIEHEDATLEGGEALRLNVKRLREAGLT